MKKSIIFLIIAIVVVGAALIRGIFVEKQKSQVAEKAQATQTVQQKKVVSGQVDNSKVGILLFDSQQKTVEVNATFSLNAMVDPKGKKISASELDVTFDPTMLKLESVTPSEDFSLVLADAKIDNEKGTVSMAFAVPLGKDAKNITTNIATLNFKTLTKQGQSNVGFAEKSGVAADGESGSIISKTVPAIITVK